jgi:hypothetical protein
MSGNVPPSEQQPSAPGESEFENGGAGTTGNGGAGTTEELPRELGGSGGMIERETGAAGSGTAASGAPAAGGSAPLIVEPVCNPADDHSTPDMVLPCAVSAALYVCRNCHGNPPLKSTGTSYVTFADIKPNAALIYGVIKAGTMPWPPYKMSAWEKSTALNWLGKNGSCAVGALRSCQ